MQNTKITLSVLATAVALALAACGGGGGDDAPAQPEKPTTPVVPQEPTSVPPSTAIPTPTYPVGDLRLAAFNELNEYRVKMGVGALKQDPTLDAAAENHLAYMKANSIVAHDELPGKTGFTGVNPYDQAVAVGASKNQWISQAADGHVGCLANFQNSVYHLQGVTSNQETIGLAIRDGYCVINFGVVTGANGSGYGLPGWGGQQLQGGSFAHSPIDMERVPGWFTATGEQPSPAPDLPNAGHPVMFRVSAPAASDVLTVSNFALTGTGGAAIPARILVPANAKSGSLASAIEDANIYRGVVFLLPTQPLTPGVYTATFSGARNGVAISKSWNFEAY